jgi:hypothetical protein
LRVARNQENIRRNILNEPAAGVARGRRGIDRALRFIQRTFIAKRVGKIDENLPPDLVAAPLLKVPMQRFVVRLTLRQHVPLHTGIENLENGFDDLAGGNRLASRSEFAPPELGPGLRFPLLTAQP